MKDAIILLLCAVALAQAFKTNPEQGRACNCDPTEAQKICEANFDRDDVLIAHEYCDKFYQCANGKPVAFRCPATLLYNPFTETCERPEDVDCGDRPISDGSEVDDPDCDDDNNDVDNDSAEDVEQGPCNCNPDEAPQICAAEGSNGVLVAHSNCNQFYKCAEGRPVAFTCAPGLLYNAPNEECDYAHNVECGDRVIPEPDDDVDSDNDKDEDDENDDQGSCNCNPEEAPAICAAPDSDNTLVAHENCDKFYVCSAGIPVPFPCPGNLLYNPYIRQCDWPRNVDCGDRIVPKPEGCAACPDSDESDDIDKVPPPGDDPDSESADIDDVPPPGDDAGNDSSDIDDLPPPGDDAGNDSSEVDDVPPPGDDDGTDNDNGGTCNCKPEEAPKICAVEGSDGILIAHENCNQFYKCDDGKPVVLTCPGNLLYNPHTEQCDWPDNVNCEGRIIPDPKEDSDEGNDNGGDDCNSDEDNNENGGTCNCNPEEAPAICAGEDSDGILIAHENCNQFYLCDHGKPVVMTCPSGLFYNPYKEECDWADNVDCGDRVIPDPKDESDESSDIDDVPPPGDDDGTDNDNGGTCNCKPEEAPKICAAEGSDGILIAHENCNQFYKCDDGKPVVLTCPGNLLYNPHTEQCDWPDNVDCEGRIIPDPKEDSDEGNDNGGNDCNSDEDNNDNGGTCNCNPEEAPAICAGEDSDGILIAHENCNQFYLCDHGKPVVMTCPSGLFYNPYKEECDWAEKVDCGDRVIPDPKDESDESSDIDDVPPPGDDDNDGGNDNGNDSDCDDNINNDNECNCDPDAAPSICAGHNSDGVRVAHENCNQFYVCTNGKPVTVSCPANLFYNPVLEVCDWPDNVECGDRIIPDPKEDSESEEVEDDDSDDDNIGPCNCNPEEAPAICAVEGSSGVQIAHQNCNQFYVCNNGIPEAFTCPGELLYNPYTRTCDWPTNVECGDRVIPEPKEDDEDCDSDEDTIIDVNDDPSQAPTICAKNDSNGVLVAHENCDKYYICTEGLPLPQSCVKGLLFNPQINQCDWPRNVDCGSRIIPGDECACDYRNAPALCSKPEHKGKLVAHQNCNQFYQCVNEVPVEFSCPANLFYNIDKELCDWPQNVDCENRMVSLNKHLESRQTLRK